MAARSKPDLFTPITVGALHRATYYGGDEHGYTDYLAMAAH